MSMVVSKKLLNEASSCVDESLEGFLSVHQGLCLLQGHRVVLRKDIDAFKQKGFVTTLTGGGSGHEPAFAGYVGQGMMSAAVQGAIFASPGPTPILAALRVLGKDHPAGVIMVYNNYTGDRLNFGLALEKAKAEGIKVGMLVNRCDCALLEGRDKTAGRGITGIVFLAKIVGAMAEEGRSFDEIMDVGKKVIENVGTLGVCLAPCSLPERPAMFTISPNELELGLGLHGEAGVKTCKMMNAHDCVCSMLDHMTDSNNKNKINLDKGTSVALILNNLGSTTEIEMNVLVKEAIQQLEKRQVKVERAYVNRFATSLEMAGFCITFINLDSNWKNWLDMPTKATVWVSPYLGEGQKDRRDGGVSMLSYKERESVSDALENLGPKIDNETSVVIAEAIKEACSELIKAETKLNQLDSESGDGDCGTTIKTGVEAILKQLLNGELKTTHPKILLLKLGSIVENTMGGSSGALYSLFFTSAASQFQETCDFKTMINALNNAIEVMSYYGGARPGNRTMLDPLHAACTELKKISGLGVIYDVLEKAVSASERSAEDTKNMIAKAGRASYVNSSRLTQADPGAVAVAIWMRAAFEIMKKMNTL